MAMSFAVGCSPVPEPLRGTWYWDSERSQNRSMSFALAPGGKGEFRLAQEIHALSWRADGSDIVLTVPTAPEMLTLRVQAPAEEIVLVREKDTPESVLRFRSGDLLQFVHVLVGEWKGESMSMNVFENGWAVWKAACYPMYVRLE